MTPEQISTLPDDLVSARHCIDVGAYWNTGLVDLAAERICELEAEVLALRKQVDGLRNAIVGHRGQRDWVGNKIDADLRLWANVDDIPWGKPIKGDG